MSKSKQKKFNLDEFMKSPETFQPGLYSRNEFYKFRGYTWNQIIANHNDKRESLIHGDEDESTGQAPGVPELEDYLETEIDKQFLQEYGPNGNKNLIKSACVLEVIHAYIQQIYPTKNIELAAPRAGNPRRGAVNGKLPKKKGMHNHAKALDIQLRIDGNKVKENVGKLYAIIAKLIQSNKLAPQGALGYYQTGKPGVVERGLGGNGTAQKNRDGLNVEDFLTSTTVPSNCGPVGGAPTGHVHYDWGERSGVNDPNNAPYYFYTWFVRGSTKNGSPNNSIRKRLGKHTTIDEHIKNRFTFRGGAGRLSKKDRKWFEQHENDPEIMALKGRVFIPYEIWEYFEDLPEPGISVPSLEQVYNLALAEQKKRSSGHNLSLRGKQWPPAEENHKLGYKSDLVYLIPVYGNPNFPKDPVYKSGHEGKYWPSYMDLPDLDIKSPFSGQTLISMSPDEARAKAAIYGFEQLLILQDKHSSELENIKELIYPSETDIAAGVPTQISEYPKEQKPYFKYLMDESQTQILPSIGVEATTLFPIGNKKTRKTWYLIAVEASKFDEIQNRSYEWQGDNVFTIEIPYLKSKRIEFFRPLSNKSGLVSKIATKFKKSKNVESKNFDFSEVVKHTKIFVNKIDRFIDKELSFNKPDKEILGEVPTNLFDSSLTVKERKKQNFKDCTYHMNLVVTGGEYINVLNIILKNENDTPLAYAGRDSLQAAGDFIAMDSAAAETSDLEILPQVKTDEAWEDSGISTYFSENRVYQNAVMNLLLNVDNIREENPNMAPIEFFEKYLKGLKLTNKSPTDAVINYKVSDRVYQSAHTNLSNQLNTMRVREAHPESNKIEQLNGPKVLGANNSKLFSSAKEKEKQDKDINEIQKAVKESEEASLLQKVDKFFEKQKSKASEALQSQTAKDVENALKTPFSAFPTKSGLIDMGGQSSDLSDDVYKATSLDPLNPDLDLSPGAEKFMPGTPGERGVHTIIPKSTRALQSSNSPFADFVANSGISTYVGDSLIFRIKNGSLLKNIRTVDDLYEHIYKKLTVKDLVLMSLICAENIKIGGIPDQSWLEQLDKLLKMIASTRVNVINVQALPVRDLLSGYAEATWDFSQKALERVAVEYIKTILVEVANCNIKGAVSAGKDGAVNAWEYVTNAEGAYKTISDFFLDQVNRGDVGRLISAISKAMTPEEITASFTGIPIRDGVYGDLKNIISTELNIPHDKIGDIPWLLRSMGVHFDLAAIEEDAQSIDQAIERTLCDEDFLKKFYEDRGMQPPKKLEPLELMPPGELNVDPCLSGIKDPVGDLYAGKILKSIFKSLKSFFDIEASTYPSAIVQSSNVKKSPIKLNDEGEPDGEYGPGDLPPYELLEHKAGFGNVTYEVLPKLRDHLRSEQAVELLEGLSSPELELLLEEREEYLLDLQDIVSEILDFSPNRGGWCPTWNGETSGADPTNALAAPGDGELGNKVSGFHPGNIERRGIIPGTGFDSSISGAGYGNHSNNSTGADNAGKSKNWHTYMLEYLSKLDLYDPMLASGVENGLDARWFVLSDDYELNPADSHRYDKREDINEARVLKDVFGVANWWVHGNFSQLYRLKQGKVTLLSILETMRWLIAIGERPQYQDLWDPKGADFLQYGAGPIPGADAVKANNLMAYGTNVGAAIGGIGGGLFGAAFGLGVGTYAGAGAFGLAGFGIAGAVPLAAASALAVGLVGGAAGIIDAAVKKPHPHPNETLVNDTSNDYGNQCSGDVLNLGIMDADVHHPIQNGVIGVCQFVGTTKCGKLWPFGAARRISYAQQIEQAVEGGLFEEDKHSVWGFQYETLYDDLQTFKSWYEDLKEIYDNLVLFDQKRNQLEEELKLSGGGQPSLKVKINKIRQMSNLTKRQENKILEGSFNIAALSQTTATDGETATPEINELTQTKKSQSLFYNINKGYTRDPIVTETGTVAYPGKTGESVSTFNDVIVEEGFNYSDLSLPPDVNAVVDTLDVDVNSSVEYLWQNPESAPDADPGMFPVNSQVIKNPHIQNRTFGAEIFSSMCWDSWNNAFNFLSSDDPVNLSSDYLPLLFDPSKISSEFLIDGKPFVEASFRDFFRDEYRYILEGMFQNVLSRVSYSSLFGQTGVSQVNTLDFIINPFCKVSEEKDLLNLTKVIEEAVQRKQELECNGVTNSYNLSINEAIITVLIRIYIVEFLLSTIFYYSVYGPMGLLSEAVIFTISETISVDLQRKKPKTFDIFMEECSRISTARGLINNLNIVQPYSGFAYGIDEKSLGLRAMVANELEYMSQIFTDEFMKTPPLISSNSIDPLSLLLETPTSQPEQYTTTEAAAVAAVLPRIVWPFVYDLPSVVFDTPSELGHHKTYDPKLPNLDYGRTTTLTNKYHEMFASKEQYWHSPEVLEYFGEEAIMAADFSPYEIPWSNRPYPQAKDNMVFSVGELMENEFSKQHIDAKSPRGFYRKGGFVLEKFIIAERHNKTPEFVAPFIHWFCPVFPEQQAGFDYHNYTSQLVPVHEGGGAMSWFHYLDVSYLAGFDELRQGTLGVYGYGPNGPDLQQIKEYTAGEELPNNNNNLNGYIPISEFKKLTSVGAQLNIETIDAKILQKHKEINEVLQEIIDYKITYYDGEYNTSDEGIAPSENPHGHLYFKNWKKKTLPSTELSVRSYQEGDIRPNLFLVISGYRRKKGSNTNTYHHHNLLIDIAELGLHARACLEKKPFYGAPDRWYRTPGKGTTSHTAPMLAGTKQYASPFKEGPGFHMFWSEENCKLQFAQPAFPIKLAYRLPNPAYFSENFVNQATANLLAKIASGESQYIRPEAEAVIKYVTDVIQNSGWKGVRESWGTSLAGGAKKPFQGPWLFKKPSSDGTEENRYLGISGQEHKRHKYYDLDYPGCDPHKPNDNPWINEPFDGPSKINQTNEGPWYRPAPNGEPGQDTSYAGAGADDNPLNNNYLPDLVDSSDNCYVDGEIGLAGPDGLGYGLPYANINTFIANLEWHKYRVKNYEWYHRCVHYGGDSNPGLFSTDDPEDSDWGVKLRKPSLEKMTAGHSFLVDKDWAFTGDVNIKYQYPSQKEAELNYFRWLEGTGQGTKSSPDKLTFNGVPLGTGIVEANPDVSANLGESAKLFDGMVKMGVGNNSHIGTEKLDGKDTKAYRVLDAWHKKLVSLREDLYKLTKLKKEGSLSGYVAAPGTNWPREPHTGWFNPYRYGLRLSYVLPAERNWTLENDLESPTLSKTLTAKDREYKHPNNIMDVFDPLNTNFKGVSKQQLEHRDSSGNRLAFADSPMQTIINHELINRKKVDSPWKDKNGKSVYSYDDTPISRFRSFIADEQDGSIRNVGIDAEEIEAIKSEVADDQVLTSQGYDGLEWLNDIKNFFGSRSALQQRMPPQWRRVYKVPLVEVHKNMAEHHQINNEDLSFNVTLQGIDVEEDFPLTELKQMLKADPKFKLLFEHVFPIEKIMSLSLTSIYNAVLSGVTIDSRLYATFDTTKDTALSILEGAIASNLDILDYEDLSQTPASSYADVVSSTRPEPGAPSIAKAFANITPFMILKGVVEASDSTIATAKGLKDTILTKLEMQTTELTDNQRKIKKTLEHPASMIPFSLALMPFPIFAPPPLGLNLTPLGMVYLALTPFGLDMKDQMRAKGFNLEEVCD